MQLMSCVYVELLQRKLNIGWNSQAAITMLDDNSYQALVCMFLLHSHIASECLKVRKKSKYVDTLIDKFIYQNA